MDNIPKLRKKLCTFLSKEDGNISKESIIKTGTLLGAMALGAAATNAALAHSNSIGLSLSSGIATATHAHNLYESDYSCSSCSSCSSCGY